MASRLEPAAASAVTTVDESDGSAFVEGDAGANAITVASRTSTW